MSEPEKPCKECGTVLPLIDFPIRSTQKDGHYWLCFPCKRVEDAARRARDPEGIRRNARRYARKDTSRAAQGAWNVKSKYGLTREAFAAKLEAQGGHCPFCPPGSVPEIFVVDHDHRCCGSQWTCGKCVRDILCHRHNRALGIWDDDPAQLRAAADYIERHHERITSSTDAPRVKAAKSGEGHQAWKGDAAGPSGMRLRNYRAQGSASMCEDRETAGCTSEHYEWVLIPGADPAKPESYKSLCAACRVVLCGNIGSSHANAVLTDEQVAEMRRLYVTGARTQKSLAAEFGVSQPMVSTVVRGTTYADSSFSPAKPPKPAPRGDVSYSAFRKRVTRLRGPADHCEQRETAGCTSGAFTWVLIIGSDPSDPQNYRQLCTSCNIAYGGRGGAGNARAKLTMDDARAIRSRHAAGEAQKDLAAEYGVTQATISKVILHRGYKESAAA